MKKYLIYIIILIIFIIGIFIYKNQNKEYSKNLFYMDTYINIKITCNNKEKVDKAFKKAEDLFETYHNLTDRYNSESELYKLNNKTGNIIVDSRLYELINYAYSWYEKTDGLFDINMGNLIDVWKSYRDKNLGIPTKEELNVDINISNIEILSNDTIKNKGANIDLGGVAKGYVTKLIGLEFEKLGITDYIINAGGNVLVGNRKDKYKIGIESPLKDGNIYQIVKGNNIAVVTSGSYERFYEYEGKLYHHIIDPNTLYPSEYMKSVTVISDDSAQADILSTTLFLMPIEDGINYIKKFDNVEAIWYSNSDEIIKSEGFKKYE